MFRVLRRTGFKTPHLFDVDGHVLTSSVERFWPGPTVEKVPLCCYVSFFGRSKAPAHWVTGSNGPPERGMVSLCLERHASPHRT